MAPTLTVSIVSWNVRELLAGALEASAASWGSRPGLELIVVDNASTDGTPALLRERFPHVHLIESGRNRGYGGANNLAFAEATGDYVLVLNPDVEPVGEALPRLVAYLEAHPGVGLVAPQLLTPEGAVQSSRRRFPELPVLFLESTWLEGLLPRRRLRAYYCADRPETETQAVDWVQGAAMLVRREVLAQVGGFDENFFMYSEELDWCRRIAEAGWEIIYFPKAQIIHHEGKSSEQVVPARHIYFQSSKVYYARKYHGALVAELLRRWLLAQYLWQYGLEGVKGLLGHRRGLRWERLAAYRQVLASKLRQQGPVERANVCACAHLNDLNPHLGEEK